MTILRISISLIFLCFTVVVVAYAATDRPVLGREVVYPAGFSNLVFSHASHKTLDCNTCHEIAGQSTQSGDRLLPSEEKCAACHAKEVRTSPTDMGNERCGFCHNDWDASGKNLPGRVREVRANLVFNHKVHVERMIDCRSCHQGLDDDARPDHLPSEALCLACHQSNSPGFRCATCHPALPSGMLQTTFHERRLMPTRGSLNHLDQWTRRHVRESRTDRRSCDACHTPSSCDRCHDGVLKPLAIHPPNYVMLHPIEARKNQPNCQSCHRYSSFCQQCHQRMGVSSELETRPGRVQYHPTGWDACTRTANHHSFQAKRNLSACVSCHSEKSCLRCHKAGSACGGSFNIHGHMSAEQLSRMQKKNPRTCKKCHENL